MVRYITLIEILTRKYTIARAKANIRRIQKLETKMNELTYNGPCSSKRWYEKRFYSKELIYKEKSNKSKEIEKGG
jgi:hypothetical protein